MKRSWRWPSWTRPARAGAVSQVEDAAAEAQLYAATASSTAWDGLLEAQRELQTRVQLEVDEGLSVPVSPTEQNVGALLDVTQRLREYRERERASVLPVYNFGGESAWSSGD